MSKSSFLKTYNASAVAGASAQTKSGQLVTASASATASSTLSYEDAYNIAFENAQSIAQQNAIHDVNVIESNECCLETFYASASADAEVYANNGQRVTSSAEATASSTLNYEDAYEVANNNAKSIAKSVAENNANIINQSFPGLITLENLSSYKNIYSIHDNSNYYYIKGSSGNSTSMPPSFFSLGSLFKSTASAVDSKGNLYIGGSTPSRILNEDGITAVNGLYTGFNYVAMWDGSTWSPLGDGLNGTVNAIVIDSSDNVYFGGSFYSLGDNKTIANNIAKWTPSLSANYTGTWSVLGGTTNSTTNATANGLNGSVTALAIDSSNNLYVGGTFNIVNDGLFATNSTNTAVYNSTTIVFGTAFTASLVPGMSVSITGYPYSNLKITAIISTTNITVSSSINIPANTTIYFSNTIANNIVKWTPGSGTGSGAWSVLGTAISNGVNSTVNALAIDASNNVYLGGSFNVIYNLITATNSTNTAVNSSTTIAFSSLPSGGTLVAGMYLSMASNSNTNTIITGVTSQTNITVSNTLTIPANTTIYFWDRSNNTIANNIAKWTASSTWAVLGDSPRNGVNGTVNALAIDKSSNVYAGGFFSIINNGLFATNSTNTVVNNTSTIVFGTALTVTLVVGMSVSITGYPYSNLKITAVTSTSNITVSSTITIAANITIYFSNTIANNIAKWTPSGTASWSVLGGTMTNGVSSTTGTTTATGSVNALAIDSNNNVYAGGSFIKLGDSITTTNYIAKWTPTSSSWSSVGEPNNGNTAIINSTLNGLPSATSSIAINKTNNTIYTGNSGIYQLFSDYINLQYNGILIRQMYLNGQIVTVYTNNKNGKKMCGVIVPTPIYQNYF